MKILLDTHIIIWGLTDDSRLSEKTRALICSPDNLILFSVASMLEISIKNQKSPEKCPYNEKDIFKYCEQAGYIPLSILPSHVLAIRELALKKDRYLANYDPFDCVLVAQAKTEGCFLLSHDSLLDNYDERCILLV